MSTKILLSFLMGLTAFGLIALGAPDVSAEERGRTDSAEVPEERDRGSLKRPDYVATPHPEEAGAMASEDRTLATMPNKSFAQHDHNSDGVVSRDEWHGSTEEFIRLDANEDSVLSRRELESYVQIGVDKFAEMDANHDGRLSRREYKEEAHYFRKLDADKDGILTRNEYYVEGRADATASAFNNLDVNRDGIVSRDEWMGDSKKFRELDRNRNGSLTSLEFEERIIE